MLALGNLAQEPTPGELSAVIAGRRELRESF